MSGLNGGPVPTSNVSVNVAWTDPHGVAHSGVFTAANGGLRVAEGTNFTLATGTGSNQIASGSALNSVVFVLNGNNNASLQTAFIMDVHVDSIPVHLDLNTGTQSCATSQ